MPVTTKVPLGPATLNRKWYLDVNTGTFGSPVWVGVFGITDFKNIKNATNQDTSDFDGAGWKSNAVTALEWGAELKISRKPPTAALTTYDPGQEVLRTASDLMSPGNTVDVRIYEVTTGGPAVEAYRGFCSVSWAPEGGDMTAVDSVAVTLMGQGPRTAITHPGSAAAAIPAITAVLPPTAGVAGGALIIVNGSGFTNASAVTVGGSTVPTSDWEVVSDVSFALKAPAHAAGAVDIVITTPGGSSATSGATKLTYS